MLSTGDRALGAKVFNDRSRHFAVRVCVDAPGDGVFWADRDAIPQVRIKTKGTTKMRLSNISVPALLFCTGIATAQVRSPVPATGLCNSGLTAKGLPPTGCLKSKPVTPLNPQTGGSSTDGNWELASPYPSAPFTQGAPDPCTFITSYGPAWVDVPNAGWFNPNDGLSQWISPPNAVDAVPGWYIYRTGFPVPSPYTGYSNYLLEVSGQLTADDEAVAIYVEDADGVSSTCRAVAAFSNTEQFHAWTQFHFAAPVIPLTHGYVYFVVYNEGANLNATALRVEFTQRYFYPY
jgi:hypothetical protein